MHRFVAVLGAVVIFFAVVWLWGLVSPLLPAFPRLFVPVTGVMSNPFVTDLNKPAEVRTDNLAGLLLALLCAISTFHVSLRRGRRAAPDRVMGGRDGVGRA